MVGARLAKQEKTRRVILAGKQYDVELGYYERQAAQDKPSVRPPCEQQSAIPMDTRLLKMLVFLFDVEQMYDPPDHALYDGTRGGRRAPTGCGKQSQQWSSGTGDSPLTTGRNSVAQSAPSSLLPSRTTQRAPGSR